ncbi:MAG: hypothetical protein ACOVQ4_01190 [Flectobacillus sp.]|uniref:hypothetical protein n=1 Tax=Flectobacillus sp. TaxID=50419 RepID=UPI003B9C4B19
MKVQHLLLILLLCQLSACAPKTTPIKNSFDYVRTGKVNVISSDKGLLSVKCEGMAENLNKAILFAEMNALENILYRGIPGSNQEAPLIPDELDAYKKNQLVLDNLVFRNGYKNYITGSEIIERHDANGIFVVQKVTFDVPALRKYLENNNIIRKFGL